MRLYELVLIVVIPVVMVVAGRILSRKMNKRFYQKYGATREEVRTRKKNPCYHCKSPRKYVCDGCYVKLRKERKEE